MSNLKKQDSDEMCVKIYEVVPIFNLVDMPAAVLTAPKEGNTGQGLVNLSAHTSKEAGTDLIVRAYPAEFRETPPFEEFYPAIFVGEMEPNNQMVKCEFMKFKFRPYDVVVNREGVVQFGAENINTLLDFPTHEKLMERYTQKHGVPLAEKRATHKKKTPNSKGGRGRADDIPF